jgi:epoxyqueuosine reductase
VCYIAGVNVGAGRAPLGAEQDAAARIEARARELGFDRMGFASAAEPLTEDFARCARLVAQGWHGTMSYLAEQLDARRRVDGPEIVPGARTVISLAWCYHRAVAEELGDPPLARLIARYARGRDYHGFLRKRLGALAAFVRSLGPGVQARAFCDTGPVLERAWAARAGLGFVGHNAMLLAPGLGSYLLLGEVVTTLALPPGRPVEPQCGSCRACLEACPTGALVAPRIVDPRRCVAYVTTELRAAVPDELRRAVGEHLFGCDRCQEACPHNAGATVAALDPGPARPLERWARLGLPELVALDEEGWRSLSRGTALRRVPAWALARNARLVAARQAALAARACGTPWSS